MKFINRFYFLVLPGLFCSATNFAAPGALSKLPLYLGDGIEPNILWLLDDSLSMRSEVTKRFYDTGDGYPEPGPGFCDSAPATQDYCNHRDDVIFGSGIDTDSDSVIDAHAAFTKESLLEACFQYNVSAYNPSTTYLPWVNADGTRMTTYTDLTDVPTNPLGSGSADLSWARFVVGRDQDGDGKFDRGDCFEDPDAGANELDNATTGLATGDVGTYGLFNVSDLDAAGQQNYIQWYVYHRKRTYSLKAALSEIIVPAEAYFGLASINNDDDVAYPVATMTNSTYKGEVMDRLINELRANSYTPLKQALHNAGKYFDAADNPESGFITSGSSYPNPIKESCQANYTVLMTDGFRLRNPSDGEYTEFTENSDYDLGDSDANPFNGAPYGDDQAGTMADIAMHYYSKDLDTTKADEVNVRSDPNRAQHMVTHAVTFGVRGNLDPATTDYSLWDQTESGPNAYGWPRDVIAENSPETLDDLFHATVNSRGLFFNSSSPEELKSNLETIMNSVVSDTSGTAAAVGFNSTSISAGLSLYQAWFDTNDWSGSLKSYDFSDGVVDKETYDAFGNIVDMNDLEWDAATVLDERNIVSTPRVVLTWSSTEDSDSDTDADGKGILFQLPSSYTDAYSTYPSPLAVTDNDAMNAKHLDDLLAHSYVSTAADKDAALAELVAWIKGDRSGESSSKFRERGSRLGDIVHSSPQFVGAPSANYPNDIGSTTSLYSDFVTAKNGRTQLVYVGANDGMLHAFDTSDSTGGVEIFSYIPEFLFSSDVQSGIRQIAEPDYGISPQHLPYVDGTPTVADVFVSKASSLTPAWRTYLVGGVNGGGKGIYVLDVTDPAAFISGGNETEIVVKEFTHENLGYTYARPQIAKLNNGRWAAIFGNGYNNSGHGNASLFILYLDALGGYVEINTGVGANGSSPTDCLLSGVDCNGLSSPSLVDLNGDSIVDRVYAGDLFGNMWAFDLTGSSGWGIAHTGSKPLFYACRTSLSSGVCPLGQRQPITSKPVIVANQKVVSASTSPNLIVMFGTGQMLVTNDNKTIDQQSFYSVWDAGPGYGGRIRSDLAENDFTSVAPEVSRTSGGASFDARELTGTDFNFDPSATSEGFGWYLDLAAGSVSGTTINPGERMVLTPLVTGNLVTFVTSTPGTGTCERAGSGWLMVADILSGDVPKSKVFSDIDEVISGIPLERMSAGMITIENTYVGADAIGDIITEEANWQQNRPSRRTSWSVIR